MVAPPLDEPELPRPPPVAPEELPPELLLPPPRPPELPLPPDEPEPDPEPPLEEPPPDEEPPPELLPPPDDPPPPLPPPPPPPLRFHRSCVYSSDSASRSLCLTGTCRARELPGAEPTDAPVTAASVRSVEKRIVRPKRIVDVGCFQVRRVLWCFIVVAIGSAGYVPCKQEKCRRVFECWVVK